MSVLNNSHFIGETLQYNKHDMITIPVPLYHCFGMVIGSLCALNHGCGQLYPSVGFDPKATLEAVTKEGGSSMLGVPTMFVAMLEEHEKNPKSYKYEWLKKGVMAGSVCPEALMRRVHDVFGIDKLSIAYGMTETSPVSFQTTVDCWFEKRVSTVGKIHPHVECKVVNSNSGALLPRNTEGEVWTRGYTTMLGYWGDE